MVPLKRFREDTENYKRKALIKKKPREALMEILTVPARQGALRLGTLLEFYDSKMKRREVVDVEPIDLAGIFLHSQTQLNKYLNRG